MSKRVKERPPTTARSGKVSPFRFRLDGFAEQNAVREKPRTRREERQTAFCMPRSKSPRRGAGTKTGEENGLLSFQLDATAQFAIFDKSIEALGSKLDTAE